MPENEARARASVLDRLIDHSPGIPREPIQQSLLDFRKLRSCVIQDLENLLNSRKAITRVPPKYREASQSVLQYGLKDFIAESPNNPQTLRTIAQEVEKSIALFEPRLKGVRVELEIGDQGTRKLSFRITGMLVVDPIRKPVEFDTYYDTLRNNYVVTG